jgi:hypothetical protein
MSINSAPIDIRLPAAPTATQPGNDVIAVIRRLLGRPLWPQERPYLNVGDAYQIPGARRGYERASNWVHTHH